MVNKIKICPVKFMIRQWLENVKMFWPIECTSLITRIATGMDALGLANISYIGTPHLTIDENYFVYEHMHKHGLDVPLVFFFPVYVNEILFPHPGYHL